MKSKIKLLIILSLALSFVLFSTCKRKEVEEPGPLGPSGFSIVLKLSASPNVISAGANRGSTTITASLTKYDGIALADKTIHFEIRDQSGNKVYLGYFEGNKSVVSKSTDSNGEVKVTYYGPLGQELTDTSYIYIFASASWDGKEFVSELQPIKVVRDVEEIYIELVANPSVLVAGTYRGVSKVTATLTESGGKPVANETVIFKINEDDSGIRYGYFEDFQTVIEKTTDSNGVAKVTYFGPIDEEFPDDLEDECIEIEACVNEVIESCDDCPTATTFICIVQEGLDLSLDLFANPNVLLCTDERPESQIIAYFKEGAKPVVNRKVFFTITSGSGTFSNDKTSIAAHTNAQGIATVRYIGPTKDEITADQTVTIQGQGEAMDGFVTGQTQVKLIRDVADFTLELTADPGILWCSDEKPTSQITALFKEGNTPLASEKIYFTLSSSVGEFSNGLTKTYAWTNSQGIATVTYYGPTKDDITADQTITIQGQVETSTDTIVAGSVSIKLIRDAADLSLKLTANPNVLLCTDTRPQSTLTATYKEGDAPVADKEIIFTLSAALGQFSNGLKTISIKTDSTGTVTTTYYGPTKSELSATQTITVTAQAETSTPSFVTATAQIKLILEN